MKKKVAIILITLTTACLLGALPSLLVGNEMARHRMKELAAHVESGMAREMFTFELVDGQVPEKEFSFVDDGEEFRYKGRLYDLVKKEYHGNRLIVFGIADEDENRLLQEIGSQLDGSQKPVSQNKVINDLQEWVYIPLDDHFQFELKSFTCLYPTYSNSYMSSLAGSPAAPPPEAVFI